MEFTKEELKVIRKMLNDRKTMDDIARDVVWRNCAEKVLTFAMMLSFGLLFKRLR